VTNVLYFQIQSTHSNQQTTELYGDNGNTAVTAVIPTNMGICVAAKEQKYRHCRNYRPMYSAVMWQQFSLAGGHDKQ